MEIHIQEGATPKVCNTPATVPLHWQQRVYDDLLRDEALGVIEKVPSGVPVTWCHRMVVTRKHDGTPRRTVDLSPLDSSAPGKPSLQRPPSTLHVESLATHGNQ